MNKNNTLLNTPSKKDLERIGFSELRTENYHVLMLNNQQKAGFIPADICGINDDCLRIILETGAGEDNFLQLLYGAYNAGLEDGAKEAQEKVRRALGITAFVSP